MYDISFDQLRQEHSEAIDYAAFCSFLVYHRIFPILGNKKAGETANKVYAKILEQEGVPCRKK